MKTLGVVFLISVFVLMLWGLLVWIMTGLFLIDCIFKDWKAKRKIMQDEYDMEYDFGLRTRRVTKAEKEMVLKKVVEAMKQNDLENAKGKKNE